MKRQAFAEGTTVSPEKTRMEIEQILARYGATGFGYYTQERRARIEFIAQNRRVRFDVNLPDPGDVRFWKHQKYSWQRVTDGQAQARWEAEVRRLWRALLLGIKAKLEVVQSGLAIFEEEFLANVVMPDGRTVGDTVAPRIAQAYESGKVVALLGDGSAGVA